MAEPPKRLGSGALIFVAKQLGPKSARTGSSSSEASIKATLFHADSGEKGWVTHTTSVQEPWALGACSIGTVIGGTKYVSFRMCELVLKWNGEIKASDQKRSILLVCELGLLE